MSEDLKDDLGRRKLEAGDAGGIGKKVGDGAGVIQEVDVVEIEAGIWRSPWSE